MADFSSQQDRFKKPKPPPPTPRRTSGDEQKISCRATNPLSLNDDLNKVFLDERQAKATTATRMFRNDELFDAMRKAVIPAFSGTGRAGKFSMWSTGCSSGEEVYSMAMIALHEFGKAGRQQPLEAFGTDINRNRIAEARAGTYIRPSRDALSPAYWRILAAYSIMDERTLQMGDLLRSMCKFMLFDMRNCPKKHTFHFIVCNHVLQYYDAPGQRHIIANLKAVLKPGGHLYLEGVTAQGLEGADLEKCPGIHNLYTVGKTGPGLSNPLFRK